MSKKKDPVKEPIAGAASAPTATPVRNSVRETVESVVVAFVLAFLFRTFEAEAFVIPTGSMAPTLMGRHKDVKCTRCGFPFRANASEEVDSETGELLTTQRGRNGKVVPTHLVTGGVCPNCFFQVSFLKDPEKAARRTVGRNPAREPDDFEPSYEPGDFEPSYKGDRIVVAKFPYEFADPKRWDVAVFKFPGQAKQNYIKRMVGLPNDNLCIHHGDIFLVDDAAMADGRLKLRMDPTDLDGLKVSTPTKEPAARIASKPPGKVEAMLQVVYDNDYVLPELHQAGWPLRFSTELAGDAGTKGGSASWQPLSGYKSFACDGQAAGDVWLRYRHLVPGANFNWGAVDRGAVDPRNLPALPQLITDSYAYNAGLLQHADARDESVQRHWVGDLAIECELEIQSESGEALLELREGTETFQCRFDLASGECRLQAGGLAGVATSAPSEIRGPGTYRVRFANVDDQLLVWVDDDLLEFAEATTYGHVLNTVPQRSDLEPVSVGSRGAKLQVHHLRVLRDVYYIATIGQGPSSEYGDLDRFGGFFADPTRWPPLRNLAFKLYELGDDAFLALGDNSPRSSDSRYWRGEDPFVHRDQLIGKAVFVYWPHATDEITGTGISVPWFPNFSRMKFVH